MLNLVCRASGRALLVLLLCGLAGCGPEDSKLPLNKADTISALERQDFATLEAWFALPDFDEEQALPPFQHFEYSGLKAREHLRAWKAARPESPAARLAMAVYLEHLGTLSWKVGDQASMRSYFRTAIQDFSAVLETHPKTEFIYATMVRMALYMGNRSEADKLRRIGLEQVPVAPFIHAAFLLGLDPNVWGRSPEEFIGYLQFLKLKYGSDPRFAYVNGYLESSKASQILKSRRRVSEKEFNDAILPEAIRLISKAIELQPTAWRLAKRAGFLRRRERYEEALADLDRALQLDAETPYIQALHLSVEPAYLYRNRGEILLALARLDEAEDAFDQAIALDPFDPESLDQRAEFYKVRAREAGYAGEVRDFIRYEEAYLGDLQAYAAIAPNKAFVRREIGNYWLSQLRPSLALPSFRGATERAPKSSKAWFGMALTFYRQGDCSAVDALKRYFELCRAKDSCALGHPLFDGIRKNMGWCKQTLDPKPENWQDLVLPPWIERLETCGKLFQRTSVNDALGACLDKADGGDTGAQYDLGIMLFESLLLPLSNWEAGVAWLAAAAEQGHPDAMAVLGEKYVFGLGVAKDAEKGLDYLEAAIEKGSSEGHFRLGALLFDGKFLPRDRQRGRALIAKAVELGHRNAKEAIEALDEG